MNPIAPVLILTILGLSSESSQGVDRTERSTPSSKVQPKLGAFQAIVGYLKLARVTERANYLNLISD